MNILIIDIDSKIPNLALKKIEKYHKDKGNHIEWNFPLWKNQADKIYVSCIFTWNKWKAEQWEGIAEIGGTGYDIQKKLSENIEKVKPKINIGFTTRGCIRNCPFCIVPQKEGKIRAVADIYDIWDSKSNKIVLLDNNILALPEHFELICNQLIKENLKVDFCQGLDIRLVNDWNANYLKNLKYLKQLRFAFDDIKTEKSFRNGMDILKKVRISMSKIMIYVLIGFNSTPKEDIERLKIIKEYKSDAFIMPYKEVNGIKGKEWKFEDLQNLDLNIQTRSPQGNIKKYTNKIKKEFARWNNRFYFRNVSFKDYLKARKLQF